MRRQPTRQIFDAEASDTDDVTQEFWGSSPDWLPRSTEPNHLPSDDSGEQPTSAISVLKSGLAAFRPQRIERSSQTGEIARTRRHGVVRSRQALPPMRESTIGELASTALQNDWDAEFDDVDQYVELSPVAPLAKRLGLGAVDPLLMRLGMVVLIGVTLVPFAMALRPSSENAFATGAMQVPAAQDVLPVDVVSVAPLNDPSVQLVATETVAGAAGSAPAQSTVSPNTDLAIEAEAAVATESNSTAKAAVSRNVVEAESTSSGTNDQTSAATVSAVAERVVPVCPQTYVAGSGDSWYRIADAAGVSPTALMAENLAGLDTPIFPGDEICLPAGATMPSQPTTTTAAPAITVPATTIAPATTAPKSTTPPTTSPPSAAEAEQIIRDVWPDEIEQKALAVAWRESNYRANAYNGVCCYGLFQLHWTAHKSWLDDFGIFTSSDLFDARRNAQAAYALYQSSGGWAPWGG